MVILLTIAVTWFVSTQLDISWPRINISPPEPRTLPVQPPSPPTEPPQPPSKPSPTPKIQPKIPDDNETEITATEQIEREVVRIVNEIRLKRGMSSLEWDDRLYNLAKMHSQDMSIRGQMFHSSIDAEYAENCWMGPGERWTADDIVKTWLLSKFHRTWLLCPNLKHVAVGIDTRSGDMYASWTFWRVEAKSPDWWYKDNGTPPDWLY